MQLLVAFPAWAHGDLEVGEKRRRSDLGLHDSLAIPATRRVSTNKAAALAGCAVAYHALSKAQSSARVEHDVVVRARIEDCWRTRVRILHQPALRFVLVAVRSPVLQTNGSLVPGKRMIETKTS